MSSQSNPQESKVVILGLSQSGKTSIRQVVFEGFAPKATALNPATVRINRKLFNLAGANINLFDIGGQTAYLNELFQQFKERTFSDVKAAIFVVDISDAANIMRSKYYFDLTIQNLKKMSSTAKVYVFAHKIDVVPQNKREAIIKSIGDIFEISKFPQAYIFGTSIFDDSIWEAMQKVLTFIYPRDDIKSGELKELVQKYNLNSLSLATSQGLVLYSEPEIYAGLNYNRMKNELIKAYFPGMPLTQAIFSIGPHYIFMKELEEDLVITAIYSINQQMTKIQESFDDLSSKIFHIFKQEEYLGLAKAKVKQKLIDYLKNSKIKFTGDLERKLDTKVYVKCDICGKQIQKSILDVSLENSENLEKGIKITSGMGILSIEINPTHECVENIRMIPIILDGNLEYRRYEKSRAI